MHEKSSEADNQENEEILRDEVRDFVIKLDKYYFKPRLLGDSSHLSDRNNLRDRE